MDTITLCELLEILKVFNATPSITPLHETIIKLILERIKEDLEKVETLQI